MKKAEVEKARILGIKQAVRFIIRAHDEPTIANEVLQYVIPHGYKAYDAVLKEAGVKYIRH